MKVAYKALYHAKMIKKKEREQKKIRLNDQIESYQDRTLKTHFLTSAGNASAM
jgi:hypothetical protein